MSEGPRLLSMILRCCVTPEYLAKSNGVVVSTAQKGYVYQRKGACFRARRPIRAASRRTSASTIAVAHRVQTREPGESGRRDHHRQQCSGPTPRTEMAARGALELVAPRTPDADARGVGVVCHARLNSLTPVIPLKPGQPSAGTRKEEALRWRPSVGIRVIDRQIKAATRAMAPKVTKAPPSPPVAVLR